MTTDTHYPDLEDELVYALHHFRKHHMSSTFPIMSKTRFFVLDAIEHDPFEEGPHRQDGQVPDDTSGRGVSVSTIARRMHCSMPAVSRTLHALEDDGLIERYPDRDDRRNTLVSLTDAGRRTYDEVGENLHELMQLAIEQMGQDRTRQMIDDLDCFSVSLDAAFETMRTRHPELGDARMPAPPAPPLFEDDGRPCGGQDTGACRRNHADDGL